MIDTRDASLFELDTLISIIHLIETHRFILSYVVVRVRAGARASVMVRVKAGVRVRVGVISDKMINGKNIHFLRHFETHRDHSPFSRAMFSGTCLIE